MIKSPPCEWRQVKNFDLSQIKKKFSIPTFQRDLASRHAGRCLESILANDFYDNVIQVGKLGDGKYEVYNGQHRLAALWRGYTEYGLKQYDLVLQIFPKDIGRRVFYRTNLGKQLTMNNRTKTFDDGTFPFFNKLREFLGHAVSPEKTSYANMMNALSFAKTGTVKPVQAHKLEQFIKQITKTDITKCTTFLSAMHQTNPHVPRTDLHRAPVFRALFKVGYENDFSGEQYKRLISTAMKDPHIQKFWKGAGVSRENIKLSYEYMVNEVAVKASLRVKEVIPTYIRSN